MMTVHAFIEGAVVCFGGKCYPALMGKDTPVGTFAMHMDALSGADVRRFGGTFVLTFKETDDARYAIHRTQAGRDPALYDQPPAVRRTITEGCINVSPPVFEKLLEHYTVAGASKDYSARPALRIHAGRPPAAMFKSNTPAPRLRKTVRSPFARW